MTTEEGGIFRSIEIGKSYPLTLSKVGGKVLTLQYLFKPANVSNQIGGKLHDSDNSSSVTVSLEGKDNTTEAFRGVKRESSSTDHESLLIFSEGSFKIQKVDEMVLNLRVQKEENIVKSKESSSKESKSFVDSRKLPKFLQKSQPKKRTSTSGSTKEVATDVIGRDNINTEIEKKPTDIVPDSVPHDGALEPEIKG